MTHGKDWEKQNIQLSYDEGFFFCGPCYADLLPILEDGMGERYVCLWVAFTGVRGYIRVIINWLNTQVDRCLIVGIPVENGMAMLF